MGKYNIYILGPIHAIAQFLCFPYEKNEFNDTKTFHPDLLLGSHIFNKDSKLAKLQSCVMLNRLN